MNADSPDISPAKLYMLHSENINGHGEITNKSDNHKHMVEFAFKKPALVYGNTISNEHHLSQTPMYLKPKGSGFLEKTNSIGDKDT